MRITGGMARGIPLRVPLGNAVRPSTDRTREAVFSSIGPLVEGAEFADLFAGSGAYGLEALSRGATRGVFVEKSPKVAGFLKSNLTAVCRSLGSESATARVIVGDALRMHEVDHGTCDLIFADPPFPLYPAILGPLLEVVWQRIHKSATSRLVLELPGQLPISDSANWSLVRQLGKSGINEPKVAILRPA